MLTVRGVTKTFDGRTVLDRLDLKVATDEVKALVGPNGVGKSTALRCNLGGEAPMRGGHPGWRGPDEGEVILGGHRLGTWVPWTLLITDESEQRLDDAGRGLLGREVVPLGQGAHAALTKGNVDHVQGQRPE